MGLAIVITKHVVKFFVGTRVVSCKNCFMLLADLFCALCDSTSLELPSLSRNNITYMILYMTYGSSVVYIMTFLIFPD